MKIIKKILIGIAVIVAIPLVIAIFTRKEYSVERQIIINKPKQQVFDYIRLLKNQDHFSVWASRDLGMKKEYKGTDGTVGFVSSWDSENEDVGKGEQEIKNITDGKSVDFELRFKKPMESNANAGMTTEALNENQTKVTWGFYGNMNYPMNFMLLVMDMDKMLGKDLQTGLDNLKQVMEKE